MLRLLAVALFAAPAVAADPVVPFDGKGFTGWTFKDPKKSQWTTGIAKIDAGTPAEFAPPAPVGPGTPLELVNRKSGCDIFTEQKFGDCVIELEFMVPKGSNSGVYVMGEYEVQILDSFGKADDKLTQGDLGALYSAAAPKKNFAKKPGEWQSFAIDFTAPTFDGDKKTANAKFVKVTLNGQVLHENVEMKQQTPGGLTGKEAATGPLMFQGDHGPVTFREIKVTPKK